MQPRSMVADLTFAIGEVFVLLMTVVAWLRAKGLHYGDLWRSLRGSSVCWLVKRGGLCSGSWRPGWAGRSFWSLSGVV